MIDAELARENRRVLLVDGFNVLHAVLLKAEREAGWWKRKQRERLLRLACEWPIADDEIWVAFDGAQPAWSVWAEPVAKVLQIQSPAGQGQDSGQDQGKLTQLEFDSMFEQSTVQKRNEATIEELRISQIAQQRQQAAMATGITFLSKSTSSIAAAVG